MYKKFKKISKSKAFTLIELLAVIIVIGIIALIAIPIISRIIESAKKDAFKDSVFGAFKAADYVLELSESGVKEVVVTDLEIKNNAFTSGNFIVDENNNVVAQFVKAGKYCAYGTREELKVAKDCALLDITNPFVDEAKFNVQTTSNTITVTLDDGTAHDEESDISEYKIEIYKDGSIVTSKSLGQVGQMSFNELTSGTIYVVRLIITNGNNLTSTLEKTVTTDVINAPTYLIEPEGYSKTKTVTITYLGNYTNEYSIDGITFLPYTTPIVFNDNGFIIARISDGNNYILGSTQSITKIDNVIPAVTIAGSTASGQWVNTSVELTANVTPSSSPSGYTYEWYNGSTKVHTSTDNTYIVDNAVQLNNTYTVKVITGVDNSGTSNTYTVKIDKVKPTSNFVTNGGNFTITSGSSVNASTKVTTNDTGSLVATRKYAWSESSSVDPASNYIDFNEGVDIVTTLSGPSKYLWIKVTDNAGNTSTSTSSAFDTYYQIAYNLNGGTGNISNETKKYGTSKTITTVVPTRNGYNFKGWSTSSTGTSSYASGAPYTNNAPITLYAVWEVAEVEVTETITFDSTTNQSRSSSKALTGFIRIVSVTVNNGSVSYSMSGNTITTNVSGGTGNYQTSCSNQYVCETANVCHTSCWSCSESYTGTCCGCPCGWQTSCCCANETSCGWRDVCSGNYYYSYVVTIRYMKGA